MANFIVLVDEDRERGARFIKQVQPRLRIVDGLLEGSCAHGDFWAVWAASKRAPLSHLSDGEGAAVLWGEAIPGPGPERLDAAGLRDRWQELSPEKTAYDGYYAGAVYGPDRGLMVGADLLGFFPVYYWSAKGVVLVGSSPELFRYHPAFRLELNPAGLVGILLTNGLIDGQTLLNGVRRLSPGHMLIWRSDATPKEVPQYRIPFSTRYFDLPFSSHLEMVDQSLKRCLQRYVHREDRYGLLLSGGLDSRLLAGYLQQQGSEIDAFTLGLHTDIEMKCAVPVARTLRLKHHRGEISPAAYPQYASLSADWEQLSTGFSNTTSWGLYPYLNALPRFLVSGCSLDLVLGIPIYVLGSAVHGGDSRDPRHWAITFEELFSYWNRWGIRVDLLKRLLRPRSFGDLIAESIDRMRAAYDGSSHLDFQKSWLFVFQHRERFHTASMAWHASFGSWPILPALDRELLGVTSGMPLATLGERTAEVELLRRRFPKLASLPLDRNSSDMTPIEPRLRSLLAAYLSQHIWPSGRVMPRDRLRYYRTFDFDSGGWISIRRAAEPYRARIFDLLDEDTFNEVLPAPQVPVHLNDPIIDASSLKLLTGLLLWNKDHL